MATSLPAGVPRLIHQVWIGPDAPPTRWLETWRDRHPGWERRLWRGPDLDRFGLRHRGLYDRYVACGRWCGAVNVARVEILLRYGGVYVDADMTARHPLDDAPFMDASAWVVRSPHKRDRITNAVMGSEPGHPLLVDYQDALGGVTELHPSWQKTGAGILTPLVKRHAEVTVVESGAFLPTTMHNRPGPPYRGVVYGEHHWGTTRGRY